MAKPEIPTMILGLLAEGERHGYELLREMEERGLLRWTGASRVSVYKNLARLENEGSLVSWKDRQGNLPERIVYAITAEGERRLKDMLFDLCSSREPLRMDYAVAAAFMDRLDNEEAAEALELRREFLQAQLKRLTQERGLLDGVGGKAVEGIRAHEAAVYREELRWVDRLIAAFKPLPEEAV